MSKFLTLEFLQHIELIYQLGKQIHEDTIHIEKELHWTIDKHY